MKKWLKTILVTSMVVCFSFLMFACGSSSLVDVSGKYSNVTDADLQKFETCTTDMGLESISAFEFNLSIVVDGGSAGYSEISASGVIDSTGDMSFQGKLVAKVNNGQSNININEKVDAYLDATEGKMYLSSNGTKIVQDVTESDFSEVTASINTDFIQNVITEASQDTMQIANKGDYVKFKIQMNNDDLGNAEAYLVFDSNNNFYGISANVEINVGEGVTPVYNIEMKVSDKTVEIPSDLGSYTSVNY